MQSNLESIKRRNRVTRTHRAVLRTEELVHNSYIYFYLASIVPEKSRVESVESTHPGSDFGHPGK